MAAAKVKYPFVAPCPMFLVYHANKISSSNFEGLLVTVATRHFVESHLAYWQYMDQLVCQVVSVIVF